ncbi:MAG: DUF3332 domain-containing protein [Bacteroidota bacterium]|nr:DUF3332 domain-containing protein [Bacteroidota bacterium]
MKKSKLIVVLSIILSGSVLFSSCIGSFNLSNKLLNWNKSLSSKFVNEVVFICFNIIPVYGISLFADAVVLNTIEFWTGSNPVANNVKFVKGDKGNYKILTNRHGYKITNLKTKEVVTLNYNKTDRSWSAESRGKSITFMTFVDENHVKMYGSNAVVELSQAGALAYQAVVTGNMAVACR